MTVQVVMLDNAVNVVTSWNADYVKKVALLTAKFVRMYKKIFSTAAIVKADAKRNAKFVNRLYVKSTVIIALNATRGHAVTMNTNLVMHALGAIKRSALIVTGILSADGAGSSRVIH
jgi:hypothetical protein